MEDVALGDVALGASSAARPDHNQTSKCFSRCCKAALPGWRVRGELEEGLQLSVCRPVRNRLKTDDPFPNREARTLPRREPRRSLTSENLAGDLPSALESGSERGPRILARGVFRLALSVVEEEADHGRTSCASLGGLESPFRGA